MLGGGTLGMVVGTPLGGLRADTTDWRFAFGALAAAAVAVRGTVPLRERTRPAQAGGRAALPGAARLGAVTLIVAVSLVGHYGAYTFLTRLAAPAEDALAGGMSTVLLAFGVASAAGIVVSARVGRRTAGALVAALALTALAVAALAVVSAPWVTVLVVLLWGIGSGALPPLAQTLILRIAGPERGDLAGALIPVLFNGGIAIGAAAASAIVGASGAAAVPIPAAAVVLVAAAALGGMTAARPRAVTARRRETSARRPSGGRRHRVASR